MRRSERLLLRELDERVKKLEAAASGHVKADSAPKKKAAAGAK